MLIQWGTSLTPHLAAPLLTTIHTLVPRPALAAALATPLGLASASDATPVLTRERLDALALAILTILAACYAYGTVRLWRTAAARAPRPKAEK
jgi:hypothetical protein